MRETFIDNGPARADIVAMAPVCALAAIVGCAYLIDLAGWTIRPATVGLPACAIAAALCAGAWRRARPDPLALTVWAATAVVAFAWIVWLAWPSQLPLGAGPDLVHHLSLIRYIETHARLVHDPGAERFIGEMVSYTPGSHVLVVLAASATGANALQAVHPVVAAAVALKLGLVALLIVRGVRSGPWRGAAAALMGVALAVTPRAYVMGSFMHDSYIAQAVAETFAVGMWWTLDEWDRRPGVGPMAMFAVCGIGVFLTWPIWIGPLLVTLGVLVWRRRDLGARAKVTSLIAGTLPILAVAAVYLVGRLAWTGIVRTSGAVLPPSLASFGLALPLFAVAGVALVGLRRPMRPVIVFLGAMAVQAAVLFVAARSAGADTPYMAAKMFYLAVYPLAVLGALGADAAIGLATGALRDPRRARQAAAVLSALLIAGTWTLVVRGERRAPKPSTALSLEMQQAADWLKARGTTTCVDYITQQWVATYWLHVVELGNPRASARTAYITDLVNPRDVIGRWVDPRGDYRYAIVDNLEQVHPDARASMVTLARFGPAAVVQRREPGACPPE